MDALTIQGYIYIFALVLWALNIIFNNDFNIYGD